jgi:hypothetical protein
MDGVLKGLYYLLYVGLSRLQISQSCDINSSVSSLLTIIVKDIAII